MTDVRDRALVLRRYPWSESSLVVHVLTASHGRVHFLARGAYRATSRYFGVLDLFDELELEWAHTPQRELSNLRAGEIVVRRRALTRDLDRFRAGLTELELVDLAARHGALDPELFQIAKRGLDALEGGSRPPDLELVAFELALLAHLGLAPALDRCAMCAGEAPPVVDEPVQRAAFSAAAGGRLCQRCAEEARAAGRRVGTLPCSVLEDGRVLARGEATIPGPVDQDRIDRARDFVGRFLESHLETRPRSQELFLAAPNRNAPLPETPVRGGRRPTT